MCYSAPLFFSHLENILILKRPSEPRLETARKVLVLRSVPYVFDLVGEELILWLGDVFRTVVAGGIWVIERLGSQSDCGVGGFRVLWVVGDYFLYLYAAASLRMFGVKGHFWDFYGAAS